MSELFLHGRLEMSSVCLRVLAAVCGERQLGATDQDAISSTYGQITGAFGQLVQERFVERLPALAAEREDDEMDGSAADKRHNKKRQRLPVFEERTHCQGAQQSLPTLNIEGETLK